MKWWQELPDELLWAVTTVVFLLCLTVIAVVKQLYPNGVQ